ncbi:MAG: hypothetical protein HZC49_01650 [Nitrospirae bacterium]|nr:hypothetical protein [Nitrospirota bacterium]
MKESYQDIVKKCADANEDFSIPNRDKTHAAFIIENLFKKADSEMYIYTGGLYDGVYGHKSLEEEAIKFLKEKSNAKLKIAFQTPPTKEEILKNDFIKALVSDESIKDKITLYDASQLKLSKVNHFCVIDGKAYRYELDHETRRAIANFGDRITADKLSSIFKIIIEESTVINL